MMTVRFVEEGDAEAWLELRCALWPEGSRAEHRDEIDQFFRGQFPREPWAVLVAVDRDGQLSGFAELSIRPYAEGCQSRRVAYLEGWFVRPDVRGRGIGRKLILASEEWGRSQGCVEFASDSEPDNRLSTSAHRAVGFSDAGLVRCYKKKL